MAVQDTFDYNGLGRVIKAIRHIFGDTLQQVSETIDVSKSHISQMENGVKSISIDMLNRYTQIYSITLVNIFEAEEILRRIDAGTITSLEQIQPLDSTTLADVVRRLYHENYRLPTVQ